MTTNAEEVMDTDLQRLQKAFDDGELEEAEISGGVEYRAQGEEVQGAVDRLHDFGLLGASGFVSADS